MLCPRSISHRHVFVRLSHAGTVSKRLNVESRKQSHTIAQDRSFLTLNISSKFERGHLKRDAEISLERPKLHRDFIFCPLVANMQCICISCTSVVPNAPLQKDI